MASSNSGNHGSSSESEEEVVKVMVVGEPGCGKSSFIQEYYYQNSPGVIFNHNGAMVYSCKFEGHFGKRRASIYEIPCGPEFLPEQRVQTYEQSNIFVFMYAIDDPSSLQRLTLRIAEAIDIINLLNIPVVFVGTKQDLRDNQQVIERLALENQSPVTFEQGRELLVTVDGAALMECSADDIDKVETVFNTIFRTFLMN